MSLRRFYRYDRFLQIFVNERRSSSYFCKRKNMHCKIIRVQCERIYIRHVDTRLFIHQLSVGRFYFFKKKALSLVTFCFLLRLILGHFFFVNAHERRSSFLYFCKRKNIHWSCKRKNIHTHTSTGARSEFYWTLDYSFISWRSVGSISLKKSSLLGHFVFCCVSSLVTFVFLSTHTNAGAHFCTFVNAKIYIRTRTSELVPNFTGHSIIHSSVVDRSVLFLLKKSSLLLSSHTRRSVYAHFSKVRIETTRFMPIFLR